MNLNRIVIFISCIILTPPNLANGDEIDKDSEQYYLLSMGIVKVPSIQVILTYKASQEAKQNGLDLNFYNIYIYNQNGNFIVDFHGVDSKIDPAYSGDNNSDNISFEVIFDQNLDVLSSHYIR